MTTAARLHATVSCWLLVRLQKQLLLQLQISERGGREDAAAETYSMLQEEREVWGVVWVKLFWCERCLEKSDKFWEKGVRHPYSVVSVACSRLQLSAG